MPYPRTSFILSAIDPDLLCPWLAVRFETDDPEKLYRLVDPHASEDAEPYDVYLLSPIEVAAVCEAFDIAFDHGSREALLSRQVPARVRAPYLIHSGYELALMVHGRKPFGFIDFDSKRPRSVALKARFDDYVAQGVLHSQEMIEDVEGDPGRRMGEVFYARKGEEWRIPAWEFIRQHINLRGDGCENRERLEGALLGYERWQNDWWIDRLATKETNPYGIPCIVKLNRAQLDWLVHAGFRALPPFGEPTFTLYSANSLDHDAMLAAMKHDSTIEAFVQFNVGLYYIMHAADFRTGGPHEIPASLIPTINLHMLRTVRILTQRTDLSKSAP